MSAVPGPVYGLEVPPGDVLIPASMGFPASFRITMAALDPTEEPEADEEGNVPSVPRSTLRLVKRAYPGLDDEDEDDEIDEDDLKAMLGGSESDGEGEEDDVDEPNGGPSDPKSTEKRRQKNAIKKLIEATQEDEDMEDVKPNGVKSKGKGRGQAQGKGKGKGKATKEESVDEEEEEEEEEEDEDDAEDDDVSDDDSDDGVDLEKFVVCTLDTERNYQQPIDITINHGEKAFFVVTGTHSVSLTGNYIMADQDSSEDGDEDDYDYDSDELAQALDDAGSEDESDELDDVADPRVTEVESEDEAPKLVEASKGKNKRLADESAEETLDDMMVKAESSKATKKQQKKLKNNQGEPVAAEDSTKKDKKVQFAKTLEQGPTNTADKGKPSKPSVGVKVVQGVTLDDRTIGKGRTVKIGDTVGVRYIGKLPNGQQFDANKKGKPFSFKVGKGSVIKGWDIGIVGMSIGGERRLTIPAHLGYGSRGMPGIPANSQLTFDVKLLEIK